MNPSNITFFKSAAAFRRWLEKFGDKRTELWIGFYKVSSGKGGLTYSESVDEALAHGWIDGIRKAVDESSYTQRFTPRKARSIWSAVNIERVRKLTEAGRMTSQGEKLFSERDPAKAGLYSFEREAAELGPANERGFKKNKSAWAFFQSQPPGYRRLAAFWVTSAKREETRAKRLAILIEDSANGRRIGPLTPSGRKDT